MILSSISGGCSLIRILFAHVGKEVWCCCISFFWDEQRNLWSALLKQQVYCIVLTFGECGATKIILRKILINNLFIMMVILTTKFISTIVNRYNFSVKLTMQIHM